MFLKSKEIDAGKVYCSSRSTESVLEITAITHEDGSGNNRDHDGGRGMVINVGVGMGW